MVVSFLVLLGSGLYLFIFYRSASPYESVRETVAQVPLGRFMRALHRYAADLLIFFTILHALRIFVQKRFHKPRQLAWFSGLFLLGAFLLEGWTGFMLVWDHEAQVLALYLAQFLDLFPLFSEKLSRTVAGGVELNASFFFFFLFLHLAIPLILLFLFWLHISHLKAPALFPHKGLLCAFLFCLACAALFFPPPLPGAADVFRIPERMIVDLWYGFWIPLVPLLGTPLTWLFLFAMYSSGFAVPLLFPRGNEPPAQVDEALCTGCTQCSLDCPYEAIRMVPRAVSSPLSSLVARVDPEACARCGICAGSCAPMFMGLPGSSGREQYRFAVGFMKERKGRVILLQCAYGTPKLSLSQKGVEHLYTRCSGSLHTSTIHTLLRYGAKGVILLTCPGRDCRERLKVRWLKERIYANREAELHPSVNRRRLLFLEAGPGEGGRVKREIVHFLFHLPQEEKEGFFPIPEECEPKPSPVEAKQRVAR